MSKNKVKHFGVRVDKDILLKFHYVCDYVGRSANRQMIQLMFRFIADYEKKYGKIELTDEKE